MWMSAVIHGAPRFRLNGDMALHLKGITMRRFLVIVISALFVACGTNTVDPGVGGPGSSTTAPFVGLTAPAGPGTTVPSDTTTTAPGQTTTSPGVTSTTGPSTPSTPTTAPATPAGPIVVAPYFFVDEEGHDNRPGPFLFPLAREVDPTVAVARASLEQLFAGPTRAERRSVPAISTTIPEGVEVLGLTINQDTATVDLSSDFGATDQSAVVAQRAAQVVFTLARFDSVFEVVFRQEGKPVKIQIGNGQLVSRPVGIHDYLEFAAALTVESPIYGGPGGNPMRVTGFGAAFEANFNYVLADADGLILEEGFAMTTNGAGWGGFDFTIRYEVDRPQIGALIVWVYSAKDGSQIDVREYPVLLTP